FRRVFFRSEGIVSRTEKACKNGIRDALKHVLPGSGHAHQGGVMHASETRTPRRRLLLQVGLSPAGAVALTAALLPGSGSAVALVPPNNTAEPGIVGNATEGRTLTANQGTWSGTTPMSFAYRWLRCPTDGGASDGSNCGPIGGSAGGGVADPLWGAA